MAQGRFAQEYRKNAVNGASPLQLIVMLYDGALKFMDAGRAAMVGKDIPKQNQMLQKAQKIVMELMSCLDMEQGGEIARNLSALYVYCMRCIIEARADNTAMLDEAERHITRITEAWKKATDELRTQAASGAAAEAVA